MARQKVSLLKCILAQESVCGASARLCGEPTLSVTSRFEIEFQEELVLLIPRKILEMKKIKHEFWIDSLLE